VGPAGYNEGETVLDILARHPSTARFIATKLTRRFVADDPPATLVDRVADVFTKTHGDIRDMVRTILTSDDFFAQPAFRAKVKSPFEFITSSLRASNAAIDMGPPNGVTITQNGGFTIRMVRSPGDIKVDFDQLIASATSGVSTSILNLL